MSMTIKRLRCDTCYRYMDACTCERTHTLVVAMAWALVTADPCACGDCLQCDLQDALAHTCSEKLQTRHP